MLPVGHRLVHDRHASASTHEWGNRRMYGRDISLGYEHGPDMSEYFDSGEASML